MIRQWVLRWIDGRQARDLSEFIAGLKGGSSEDMAVLLATATMVRKATLSLPLLLDPAAQENQNIMTAAIISKAIRDLQHDRSFIGASAWMVWLHSVRGAQNPRLRYLAKDMWRELARGFPYAPAVFADLYNAPIDRADIAVFPRGLDPAE